MELYEMNVVYCNIKEGDSNNYVGKALVWGKDNAIDYGFKLFSAVNVIHVVAINAVTGEIIYEGGL